MVAGPMSVEPPFGVRVVAVSTASEMGAELDRHAAKADLIVMAAAVADYRPVRASRDKIKREPGPRTLVLEPNPDLLAGLASRRRPGQVLVGFALETSSGVARARAKLVEKGVDLMVLNHPQDALGSDTNRVTLVEAKRQRALPRLTKREVADAVWDRALELRQARERRGSGKRRAARRARQT